MKEALLVLSAFLVMEPVTYLAHRYIFHRFGKEPYGLLIPVLPRRRPRKDPQVLSTSTP